MRLNLDFLGRISTDQDNNVHDFPLNIADWTQSKEKRNNKTIKIIVKGVIQINMFNTYYVLFTNFKCTGYLQFHYHRYHCRHCLGNVSGFAKNRNIHWISPFLVTMYREHFSFVRSMLRLTIIVMNLHCSLPFLQTPQVFFSVP